MEYFTSAGQLVTLGLVDSSIGAVSKWLALVDVEASIAEELASSNLSSHVTVTGSLALVVGYT